METIRSFLAVRLELETARRLAEIQRQLKPRCEEWDIKVAWVPPPNMHVTIRFLGQVEMPMLLALEDMLKPILSRLGPFEVEVAGLGAFENPRVIWVGLRDGVDRLIECYKTISDCLVEAGFPKDDKPFKSHVTLGRVKGGQIDALESCLIEKDEVWGKMMVGSLYCYRSDLKPTGAEYDAIWQLPFPGSAHKIETEQNSIEESTETDRRE